MIEDWQRRTPGRPIRPIPMTGHIDYRLMGGPCQCGMTLTEIKAQQKVKQKAARSLWKPWTWRRW